MFTLRLHAATCLWWALNLLQPVAYAQSQAHVQQRSEQPAEGLSLSQGVAAQCQTVTYRADMSLLAAGYDTCARVQPALPLLTTPP